MMDKRVEVGPVGWQEMRVCLGARGLEVVALDRMHRSLRTWKAEATEAGWQKARIWLWAPIPVAPLRQGLEG